MGKRTFKEVREKILDVLDKPKSITQIAKDVEATWKTTQRHLIWLDKMEGRVKIIRKSKRIIVYKKK